nr:hypothetical protein [Tanacetum cinerariifolium]
KELNMRQQRWIELFSDYDCEIRYYPRKANVLADAFSRKERVKPRRVRAIMLRGLNQQMEKKEDGGLYFIDQGWDFIDRLCKDNNYGRDSCIKIYFAVFADVAKALGTTRYNSWDTHLPLAEFSKNHSYHSSIQCAPFEALYGRRCRLPVLWAEIGESGLIEPKLVQETTDKVVLIKEKLKATMDRQKSYADNRRKPLEFEAGDRVLLKDQPVSYRLRLPEELSSVHDIFHVSNLKKCLADANLHVPLDEIKIDKTLRFVEEPIEIMNREVKSLKHSKISIVKVRWNSKCGPEFTWEREDHMKTNSLRGFCEVDVHQDEYAYSVLDMFVDRMGLLDPRGGGKKNKKQAKQAAGIKSNTNVPYGSGLDYGISPLVDVTNGLSLIAMKISTLMMLGLYTNSMCLESWGRSIYAKILIKSDACNGFSNNLVLDVPNLEGPGYSKEAIHVEYQVDKRKGGSSGDDEGFVEVKKKKSGNNGKKNVSSSGNGTFTLSNSFEVLNVDDLANEQVESSNKASTSSVQKEWQSATPLVEKINMFEKQMLEEKCMLVDADGKPLKKVDHFDDHDSEDEVEPIDNEMANFLASKPSGVRYGTKSLLEQYKETYGNAEYDYDPYDEDLYGGQEIPDHIQSIYDNLDFKVRGRKKKHIT